MGGKRPDQYRISPADSRTTDNKFLPIDKEDARHDAELYGRVMKGSAKRKQPIPPETVEPEVARERKEEMERQEQVHETEEEDRQSGSQGP